MRLLYSFLFFLSFASASPSIRINPPAVTDPVWSSVCLSPSSINNNKNNKNIIINNINNTASNDWITTPPTLVVKSGKQNDCIVSGFYEYSFETTGWDRLGVYTETRSSSSSLSSDELLAYSAGYLEGYLGAKRLSQSKINFYDSMFDSQTPFSEVTNFIKKNINYLKKQYQKEGKANPFWEQINLINTQTQGIGAGYTAYNNEHPEEKLETISFMDMMILNFNGDMEDLLLYLIDEDSLSLANVTRTGSDIEAIADRASGKVLGVPVDHCSALVKVTADKQDVFLSHITWGGYQTMLRVLKLYSLVFSPESQVVGYSVEFSSYPGLISSVDDFYHAHETQLTILETTNPLWDDDLYEYVTYNGVAEWHRAVLSVRLSEGGADFKGWYEKNQMGTYNNEYIVFDHSLFTPGQPLPPNTFWIISELPEQVEAADISDKLNTDGYWAGYNVPYFTDLYDKSGLKKMAKQYGDYYFGQFNNFRALQFARDQGAVQDIEGMKKIMQANNWNNDDLAKGPEYTIAARYDIPHIDPTTNKQAELYAEGGIDTKLVSHSDWVLAQQSGNVIPIHLYNGPTTDGVEPFQWSTSEFKDFQRVGQPDKWTFPWVHMGFDFNNHYKNNNNNNNNKIEPKTAIY